MESGLFQLAQTWSGVHQFLSLLLIRIKLNFRASYQKNRYWLSCLGYFILTLALLLRKSWVNRRLSFSRPTAMWKGETPSCSSSSRFGLAPTPSRNAASLLWFYSYKDYMLCYSFFFYKDLSIYTCSSRLLRPRKVSYRNLVGPYFNDWDF